ncbi:TRAP transporter substrate-binding protein [Pelagibacterium montanilacus]|uniref:TRAP transporter substrate-binding protein n=1 Tax=Pelagibacterium montanilacus TaxID=2185280 RepID=UPI0013E0A09C|nr:TRAP transporter substrate-binding protein [Pelagibacterium montanilacus]
MHQTSMRMGGYQGPNSVLTAGLARFEEDIRARLGDGVDIARTDNVTADGQTARSLFDGIEAGSFDLGYMASGYITAKVPELGVLDLPFSVADRHAAYRALDGKAGELLREAIHSQTGYKVLGFWDNGFRHLTNARHAIVRPADCEGLVVRTLDNRIYVETMAAMGFTPKVTDVRELKESVANGTVDAQENPMTNSVLFGLHAYHKHLTLTGHFFGVALFLCNAEWLDALPADVREAVRKAALTATAHQRHLAEAQDTEALAELRSADVAIVEPDRAAFRAACAPIIDKERAGLPDALLEAYLAS